MLPVRLLYSFIGTRKNTFKQGIPWFKLNKRREVIIGNQDNDNDDVIDKIIIFNDIFVLS
jgi:hypothetical protein